MAKGINPATGMSHRFIDRTGTRNGRLLFTKYLGVNSHRHSVWEAICDCGKKKPLQQHQKQSLVGVFRPKLPLPPLRGELCRRKRRCLGITHEGPLYGLSVKQIP